MYCLIIEVFPLGICSVPLDLFTVKGSSLLYEVKVVDFVKMKNKEAEFPCDKCFVIQCEFPGGSYSFTPDSGC